MRIAQAMDLAELVREPTIAYERSVVGKKRGAVLGDPAADAGVAPDDLAAWIAHERTVDRRLDVEHHRPEPELFLHGSAPLGLVVLGEKRLGGGRRARGTLAEPANRSSATDTTLRGRRRRGLPEPHSLGALLRPFAPESQSPRTPAHAPLDRLRRRPRAPPAPVVFAPVPPPAGVVLLASVLAPSRIRASLRAPTKFYYQGRVPTFYHMKIGTLTLYYNE